MSPEKTVHELLSLEPDNFFKQINSDCELVTKNWDSMFTVAQNSDTVKSISFSLASSMNEDKLTDTERFFFLFLFSYS